MKFTCPSGLNYTRKLLIPAFFILPAFVFSQDTSITYIEISRIDLVDTIKTKIQSPYISKDSSVEKYISSIQFHPGLIHQKGIPPKYVTKMCW